MTLRHWVIPTLAAGALLATPAAADVIRIPLDKAEILRLDTAASVVVVGSPEVADAVVESPKLILLIGKKTGETNLLLMNGKGEQIREYKLLVVPESDRHVTVHRGSEIVNTLSCNPTCVGVKNPGLEGSEKKGGGADKMPAGGGGGGAAPPAAAPPAGGAPKGGAPKP